MGRPSQLVPQAVLTGGEGGELHTLVEMVMVQQVLVPALSRAQKARV